MLSTGGISSWPHTMRFPPRHDLIRPMYTLKHLRNKITSYRMKEYGRPHHAVRKSGIHLGVAYIVAPPQIAIALLRNGAA